MWVVEEGVNQGKRIIYVCEVCLLISTEPGEHHGRPMFRCDAGEPGSERSRPLMTPDGELKTHAPAWWVEHCLGRLPRTEITGK